MRSTFQVWRVSRIITGTITNRRRQTMMCYKEGAINSMNGWKHFLTDKISIYRNLEKDTFCVCVTDSVVSGLFLSFNSFYFIYFNVFYWLAVLLIFHTDFFFFPLIHSRNHLHQSLSTRLLWVLGMLRYWFSQPLGRLKDPVSHSWRFVLLSQHITQIWKFSLCAMSMKKAVNEKESLS